MVICFKLCFFKQQNVGHYQNVLWVLLEYIMGTTHVNIRKPIYTDVGIWCLIREVLYDAENSP